MAQQFNSGSAAWCMTTEEKAKHETVFNSLKPKNGKLTGDQAKKYLMLSNLPTPILGLIWTLSDLDKDGMMTQQEFSIAMYLTQSKLKGIELPRVLPYSLKSSSVPKPSSTGFSPSLAQPNMLDNIPVMSNGINTMPLSQPIIQPISSGWGTSSMAASSLSSSGWGQAPSRSNTWSSNHTLPNSMASPLSSVPSAGVVMNSNIGNLTTITAPTSSPTPINIIPAPKRLKYTQMFKAADHLQNGYLGGELARQVLIQSNIAPQKLAAIWELSDLNKDGNLDLEEFIIAMHLIDCSKAGLPIPDVLPNEIIPPQYKYQRSDSITGQPGPVRSDSISGGSGKERTNSVTDSPGGKNIGFAASFEDRKKDNFERGRMELERRRRELQEKETKQKEEQERVKREEEERLRRAREESELKRQQELENERKQKEEMEREQEVLRKKMIEQRLAAQVEAERSRQREWEKRKKEELLNQKGIERDIVAGLKTRLTKLQIELKAQTAIRDDLNNSLKEKNVESAELSSMVTRLNQARDVRIREINQLQIDIRQSSAQLRFLKEDHEKLGVEMNKRDSTTTSEAYGGVRSSIHEMRGSLAKMRNNIVALQAEAAVIIKERKKCSSQASELSSSIQEKQQENSRLKRNFDQATKENRVRQARKKADEDKRKADLLSWQKKQAEERLKSEAEAKKRKEEFEKKKNNDKSKKHIEKEQAKMKAEEIQKIALERKKVKQPEIDISSQKKEIKRQDDVVQKQQEALVARPALVTKTALKPGMLPPPQDNKKEKKPVAVPRPRPSSTSTLGTDMSPFDAIKFEDENRKKDDEKKLKKEKEEREAALKVEEKRRKEMVALKQKQDEVDAKKKSKEEEVKRRVEEMQKKRLQRKSQKKPPERPATAPVATSPQLARPPQPAALVPKVALLEVQTSSAPTVSVNVIPSAKKTTKRFKMIYAFEKRNDDELSLEENDIVTVTSSHDDSSSPPPGWLSGTCKGQVGLFPITYAEELPAENYQDYVELDPKSMVRPTSPSPSQGSQNNEALNVPEPVSLASSTEDIYAVPVPGNKPIEVYNPVYDANEPKQSYENIVPPSQQATTPTQRATTPTVDPSMINRSNDDFQVVALYQYRALKDDQLSFNKNDNINVQSQEDIWWYGECQGKFGWFPKSYVRISGLNNGSVSLDDKTDQISITSSSSSITTDSQNTSGADAPVIGECIAIFDYAGEEGDLHFMEGDVITITKKDSEWWEGYCNGKFGLFPENYVQMKEPEIHKKKPDVATVTSSFTATGEKEVSLTPGQLIHVIQKNPSGWWQGEIQARGKKKQLGWFPASHVQLLGQSKQLDTQRIPSPALSNTASDGGSEDIYSVPVKPINQRQAQGQSYQEVPIRKSDNENQALAVYSYSAQQDDELTFFKGSVLKVISQDSDWWKGELNGLVGVFPSNYVQLLSTLPDQNMTRTWSGSFDKAFFQSMSHMERERQNSVYELIDTEQAYMNDLSLTLEIFYNPLAEAKILTEHELNLVFVNWKQLIMCNMKLLKGMLVRKTMSSNNKIEGIGDILVEQLPNFTPYIRFCSCQLKACKFLQMKVENDPVFKQFEKKCAGDSRLRQNLPLSSYLLKPLQRITKYPLLIQRILNYTPEEHHDRPELEVSLEKAEELCSQVNEAVRSQESSDRLEWLQSRVVLDGIGENLVFNSQTNCLGQRKFLYHGTLYKQKSNKELKAVLFNDFLLLCRIQSSHFGTKPMVTMFSDYNEGDCTLIMYKTPIFLNEVTIKQPNGPEVNEFVFHLSHIDRVYSFRTDTKTERNAWISKINKASEHYIETERFQRQRAHRARSVLGQGYGKLIVTIIEGSDLKASDPTGTSDPYCEASMGSQEHKTKVIPKTLNPKWNSQLPFTVKDQSRDVLCITVFDRDFFSPNDFLGRTEVSLASLLAEGKGPWTKRLLLHEVATGELLVRFELQTFVT